MPGTAKLQKGLCSCTLAQIALLQGQLLAQSFIDPLGIVKMDTVLDQSHKGVDGIEEDNDMGKQC